MDKRLHARRASWAGVSTLAVAIMLAGATRASAQVTTTSAAPTPPAEQENTELAYIVVTGTSIRGVAPTGSDLISLGRDAIAKAPVADVQQLLTQVPQLGLFNTLGTRSSSTTQDQTQNNPGPAIHNIQGGTLTLLNGRRFTGGGIIQIYPDPSIIPLMALERVEVVPDGASGVYGADAVAGVANFITRRSIRGIEANGRLGFDGKGYKTFVGSIGAGKDWSTGSSYLVYQYNNNDTIRLRDRYYVRPDQSYRGGVNSDGTFCSPANITVGGVNYALPGRVAGTVNRCTFLNTSSLVPEQEQHAAYGRLTQNFGDAVRLTADVNYSNRTRKVYGIGNAATTYTVTQTSPFYVQVGGTTADQTVSYNPEFDFPDAHLTQRQENLTGSAVLDVKLRGDWHVTASFTGSKEWDRQTSQAPVIEAIRAAITAGTFNPYGIGAANNPVVLASVSSYPLPQTARTSLVEGLVQADGTLFSLPGGDVRLAIGSAVRRETIRQQIVNFSTVQNGGGARDIRSAFAETYVPIVGSANASTFIHALELSAAVRIDDYSALGTTTNPKFGVRYEPVKGVALRASYGTSFNAPNLGDVFSVNNQVVGFGPFVFPTGSFTALISNGGNVNLQPQTAETYSFGGEITAIRGLRLSGSYFHIDYKNLIGQPDKTQTAVCLQRLSSCDPALYQYFNPAPTQAELAAILLTGPLRVVTAGPYNAIIDGQQHNLGLATTAGLDFDLSYRSTTDFGSITGGIAGTYFTKRTFSATVNSAATDVNQRSPKTYFRGHIGTEIGKFDADIALNYVGKYDNIATAPSQPVTTFKTVDLRFGYSFEKLIGRDVRVSVDASNVFDAKAPYVIPPTQNGLAYSNVFASVVGRVISVSAGMKF